MDQPSSSPTHKESLSWENFVILLLIVACLMLTCYFGIRLYQSLFTLRNHHMHPGQTDVSLIQNWMTVPYISKMYTVPEDILWNGLSIPPTHNRFKPLSLLEREFSKGNPGAIEAHLKQIIQTYQAQFPPPHPNQPTQVRTP